MGGCAVAGVWLPQGEKISVFSDAFFCFAREQSRRRNLICSIAAVLKRVRRNHSSGR